MQSLSILLLICIYRDMDYQVYKELGSYEQSIERLKRKGLICHADPKDLAYSTTEAGDELVKKLAEEVAAISNNIDYLS